MLVLRDDENQEVGGRGIPGIPYLASRTQAGQAASSDILEGLRTIAPSSSEAVEYVGRVHCVGHVGGLAQSAGGDDITEQGR